MAPWLWSILELWVFHGILVFPWKNGGAKDLKKEFLNHMMDQFREWPDFLVQK